MHASAMERTAITHATVEPECEKVPNSNCETLKETDEATKVIEVDYLNLKKLIEIILIGNDIPNGNPKEIDMVIATKVPNLRRDVKLDEGYFEKINEKPWVEIIQGNKDQKHGMGVEFVAP